MRKQNFKTSGEDFILHETSVKELERERNKLFSKALKMMPNSPAQLKVRAELDKITAQLEKLKNEPIDEDLTLPINVGDTVLMGRFKNKKVKVKDIGEDEHGMPTINGKKAATFRTLPKDKLKENIESSLIDRYDVELDLYEQPDYIELSKIIVPEDLRGLGIGTKVMEDLIKYAKDNNKDIFTTPSNAFGGNKSKLEQFYKSFGFKPNSGKYRDFRSRESLKLALSENILLEGGAYGRMPHPSDSDTGLTFGDLKNIVNQTLSGELESPTEKTDGQAIAISWKDGQIIVARNKGHLKNSGETSLNKSKLIDKFKERDELSTAFNMAINDLERAILQLSDAQRDEIFKNGNVFINCEIIYPPNKNVIPYDTPMIVIHGTMECDSQGNVIQRDAEIATDLANIFSNAQLDTFSIQGPPKQKLPSDDALKSKIPMYIQKIENLQNELGLTDSDGFQNVDKTKLIQLEDIFLELGADLLTRIPSVLIQNPTDARKKMFDELNYAIENIETDNDLKSMEKLEFQLNRLNKLGGFEKIVPIEGIVFSYNGNSYKLTGAFAPLNQILGILKYSK
jgi:predicted GNAT family N-acyltransferase